MNYSFIEYTAEYHAAVVDLQRYLWSRDRAINAAYLNWKYEQNPYLQSPVITLALHDGHLVGMRGAWGACWKLAVGKDPVIIPCAGDTVVAPDHRGHGLLNGLNQSLLKVLEQRGLPYVLNLSASKPVHYGSMKEGWRSITYYDELSRMHPILKKSWARKVFYVLRKRTPKGLRQKLKSGLTRSKRSALPAGVKMTTFPRSKAMEQLVQRVEPPGTIGHVRNHEYFSWRYRCPLSRYRFLYSGSQTLDGFMVLQNNLAFPRGTNIVDWEVNDASRFEKLIRASIRLTGIGDLHIWSVSMSVPIMAVLVDYGFEVSRYRLNEGYQRSLIMKETGSDAANQGTQGFLNPFTDDKEWNLRMIFSDDY